AEGRGPLERREIAREDLPQPEVHLGGLGIPAVGARSTIDLGGQGSRARAGAARPRRVLACRPGRVVTPLVAPVHGGACRTAPPAVAGGTRGADSWAAATGRGTAEAARPAGKRRRQVQVPDAKGAAAQADPGRSC